MRARKRGRRKSRNIQHKTTRRINCVYLSLVELHKETRNAVKVQRSTMDYEQLRTWTLLNYAKDKTRKERTRQNHRWEWPRILPCRTTHRNRKAGNVRQKTARRNDCTSFLVILRRGKEKEWIYKAESPIATTVCLSSSNYAKKLNKQEILNIKPPTGTSAYSSSSNYAKKKEKSRNYTSGNHPEERLRTSPRRTTEW